MSLLGPDPEVPPSITFETLLEGMRRMEEQAARGWDPVFTMHPRNHARMLEIQATEGDEAATEYMLTHSTQTWQAR